MTESLSKQISLRSVDGKEVQVKVNGGDGQTNGKTITLNHTTEMYYEVDANKDGYIVIQVEKGFLGIGNLKLISGNPEAAAVMPTVLTEDDYALVATTMRLYAAPPEEEIPEESPEFTPEKFVVDIKAQKKKYTATVTTSSDVEYITVNGEVITKAKVKKLFNEKEFTFEQKFGDNATVELEIVAYNSDDLASEAKLFVIENESLNDKPGKEDKKPGKEEDKKLGKVEDKKPGKDNNKGGKK